jgi:hypothetical protein
MTPEELRLECLKLVQQTANASGILLASGEIILRARAYADFVMDRNGNGSAVKTNDAPNPEFAPEEGFRIPTPSAAQFEPSAFAEAVPTEPGPRNNGKPSSPRRRHES